MGRLVINNGHLIDPYNNISSKLNIAIEKGKVVEISREILKGDKIINGEGLIVSPGFVDCHIHESFSTFQSMLRMGVTTAIGGNCGSGPDNIPKYLDYIDEKGIPINLALLVPHGTLRKLEGVNNKYKKANKEEILNMKKIAEEYLERGCLGISFGIRYIPGINEEELLEISSTCQKDNKIVAAHIRDDALNVIDAAEEFISIGEKLEIPLQISHIGSMGAYGQMEELLSLIDDYNSKGLDISSDCYPYYAFSTSIGGTTYDDGFLERYNINYDAIEIAEGKYKGRRCTEKLFNELRTNYPQTITIGHVMEGEDVDKAIAHPNVFIASDGFMKNFQGHPRAAGTFPKVISEYVREKKILTLYEAIKKMTILPAKRFNIEKGHLSIGADGDIVIFDFNKIKDRATFNNPALPPEGIKYVIIDGKIAVENNIIKEKNLGKLVRY